MKFDMPSGSAYPARRSPSFAPRTGSSATGHPRVAVRAVDTVAAVVVAALVLKTVNGVKCREWLVAMKGAPSGLEHDTVCLGLQDHLPYEVTVDWAYSHTSFSDYNTTIQFDLPAEVVKATTSASN